MSDIGITWDNTNGVGDWSFVAGDVATGPDLHSAVLCSLFSDRRAPADFPLAAGQDPRGHWSDTYETRPLGSLLWTLDRAVFSAKQNIVLLARDYCQEALQWLIDDGVAASVDVRAQRANAGVSSGNAGTTLAISIVITEPVTFAQTALSYSYVWGQAV